MVMFLPLFSPPLVICLIAIVIRPSTFRDSEDVITMMTESVDKLGRLKYTNEQADAWLEAIPTVENMESLMDEPDRIGWIAVDIDSNSDDNMEKEMRNNNINDGQTIVGYLDWVQTSKKLDMLYVHPNYARKQVASRLLQHLVLTLQQQQLKQRQHYKNTQQKQEIIEKLTIKTEASESSKPFFEKHGFHVMERQEFTIGGVRIHNYKMICLI